MPLEFGLWKVSGGVQKVAWSSIDRESKFEELIATDVSILGLDLLLIGRQVVTDFGKKIDLLAIDRDGNLVVIELKRDRTAREVVAQLLDYGSWVRSLSFEAIVSIYKGYANRSLEEAFVERFGGTAPESINEGHRLVVVASELDASTERIINYLNESFDVPINTVFFRYFKDGKDEYIARSWLVDPSIVEMRSDSSKSQKSKEPWNGQDFYVSLGEGDHRTWADCVKYGFISGGQGRWYSRTLEQLYSGARVFVHIPERGYVGVGIVRDTTKPVNLFSVDHAGRNQRILELPLQAAKMSENSDDPDKSEYLVAVDWIKTVPVERAIWEKGLFANQNTVCKLRSKFTLERLRKAFGVED